MAYRLIVNGRELSEQEAQEHLERRVALHGGIAGIIESRGSGLGIQTDDTYMAQHRIRDLAKQFPNEEQREQFIRDLKANGMPDDVTYDPTLAHCPNDPGAMCTIDGARAKRKDQEKSFEWHGPPVPSVPLNKRIIERNRRHMVALDPSVAERDQREVTEQIIDEHAPPPPSQEE